MNEKKKTQKHLIEFNYITNSIYPSKKEWVALFLKKKINLNLWKPRFDFIFLSLDLNWAKLGMHSVFVCARAQCAPFMFTNVAKWYFTFNTGPSNMKDMHLWHRCNTTYLLHVKCEHCGYLLLLFFSTSSKFNRWPCISSCQIERLHQEAIFRYKSNKFVCCEQIKSIENSSGLL